MNITELIKREIAVRSELGFPDIMAEFVLRNGQEFKAVPWTGKPGIPKECFSNATNLRVPHTTYVEGYGLRKSLGLLIQHAWRVTDTGEVIDVTWNKPEECLYYGVKIGHRELWDELERIGYYGILDGPRGLNLRFMVERDPMLLQEHPKIKEFIK